MNKNKPDKKLQNIFDEYDKFDLPPITVLDKAKAELARQNETRRQKIVWKKFATALMCAVFAMLVFVGGFFSIKGAFNKKQQITQQTNTYYGNRQIASKTCSIDDVVYFNLDFLSNYEIFSEKYTAYYLKTDINGNKKGDLAFIIAEIGYDDNGSRVDITVAFEYVNANYEGFRDKKYSSTVKKIIDGEWVCGAYDKVKTNKKCYLEVTTPKLYNPDGSVAEKNGSEKIDEILINLKK